uniref:Uncharacterized protein n=1 Tax=Panthera tigris altaica TaxID=74533 RepID=A0A8C9KFL4_PANTA
NQPNHPPPKPHLLMLPHWEKEILELETDMGELLGFMKSDDTRAARVIELLVDCYKPTDTFSGLGNKGPPSS